MVEFGKILRAKAVPEWREKYVSYAKLKRMIDRLGAKWARPPLPVRRPRRCSHTVAAIIVMPLVASIGASVRPSRDASPIPSPHTHPHPTANPTQPENQRTIVPSRSASRA